MTTAAGGFAERVRELKERSGLSYGALAKKLHMSTSTLHRYCNGDAVPTEFAPVERLARACGATRDEMVALHRSWILADEARRGRGSAAEAAPTPAPAPAAPGPAPEAVTAAQAPGPAAEPEPASATEPEPAPGSASGADPDATVVVTDRPAAPPSGSSGSSGRFPRKRAVLVAAASAVVVLAVTATAAVVTQRDEDPDPGRRPVAGASAPTGTAAPRDLPARKSPSPSASASSSAPAPSGPPSPSDDARGRDSGPEYTGTPVAVGISAYNWELPCGENYLMDRKPDEVVPPPAPQDAHRWAGTLGAVQGGSMYLQLTATGKLDRAAVLNGLHVRMVGRSQPLDWDVYTLDNGCGGGITPQTFDVDLDAGRPVARAVAGTDGELKVPAKDFPYKVSASDPQVFNLDLHTKGHDVSWYLELDWSLGDRHGTLRIDDDGKPFRLSAIAGHDQYQYLPDKGEWTAWGKAS
ncbi:helix-turn-helix domain-containing protein [Streptomyces sp. NPDC001941]|uniref:helix-turn-helix domain-containing protein n=1 Tax=Streptomyces sp. NPDC001941 TaxID=3154659 RepID=UPI003327F3C5